MVLTRIALNPPKAAGAMALWHSDVLVEISLLPTEEAGWPPAEWYGCAMEIGGEYFDARLDLSALEKHTPGHRFRAPLKFLSPEDAMSRIEIGKTFDLWEDRAIGSAKVVAMRLPGSTRE